MEPLPRHTGVTPSEAADEYLDYLDQEAFYVVDERLQVAAFRLFWLGHDLEIEEDVACPTVGHGIVREIRWHNREPLDDAYARGQFDGMKRLVASMIDRGVFDRKSGAAFLATQVVQATDPTVDIHVNVGDTLTT